MPCSDSLIPNIVTFRPDDTIAQALAVLQDRRIRSAPVVDADGRYLGMFSLRTVLSTLLPVAVTMPQGLRHVDFIIGLSPGIAAKLDTVRTRRVGDHTDAGAATGYPDTTIIAAIRLLTRQGSPLPIVTRKNGQFVGLVSEQSILHTLQELGTLAAATPAAALTAEQTALLREFGILPATTLPLKKSA